MKRKFKITFEVEADYDIKETKARSKEFIERMKEFVSEDFMVQDYLVPLLMDTKIAEGICLAKAEVKTKVIVDGKTIVNRKMLK
jgi:hypothetical protein